MKIVFTIDRTDLWQYHWHNWTRYSLRLVLALCVLPLAAFGVCYLGGFGLLLSEITAGVVAIVPFGAGVLAVLDLLRKVMQWRREISQEHVAEAGKFDFRWGVPSTPGYYHHWSYFTDLMDVDGSLFFILGSGVQFRVPRQAFPASEDADNFWAFARRRWEAAKQNQRHNAGVQDDTVWPPPPRLG